MSPAVKHESSRRVAACLLAGGIILTPYLGAHEDPKDVIDALTSRFGADPATVPLLHRRAIERRALGQLELASADLARALQIDPEHVPTLVEASSVELALGRHAVALRHIDAAIARTGNEGRRAALYMSRVRIHETAGDGWQALADCRVAFSFSTPAVDWYLTRSRIHARLELHDERVRGLHSGLAATGSALLEAEWIEAMIDAGWAASVLPRIEVRLEAARWRSSWLIRRARGRLAMGDEASAQADLRAAIAEIGDRLRMEKPDLMLVADRGLARALLGERSAALADLRFARERGAKSWNLVRLATALERSAGADVR